MTVADLIRGAFRVLGVLASGEAATGDEQTDAFNALNDMVDMWANEQLLLFANVRGEYALTPNINPQTIGVGGTINTTRPIHIEGASVTPVGAAGSELPLTIVSDTEWQSIQGKNSTGIPVYLRIATTYPQTHLWLNPIPALAHTLVLYTHDQISRFAATSTTVSLPPGFARALRYNLAKELAPEYGVALSAEAADIAVESKAWIKRLNDKPSYLRSDAALLRGGHFNIITGG